MTAKTCAIDYLPLRRYSSRQKRVSKIPYTWHWRDHPAQPRSDDPDGAGAARQSVAVELVLFRDRREGRAGWQLGVSSGRGFLAILVKGELNG